jgi:hypothetical protein
MRVINDTTDKEGWEEICSQPRTLTRQILRTFERHSQEKTEETINWVVDVLLWRKHCFNKTKIVSVFDGVAKSDTIISPELIEALTLATKRLVEPRKDIVRNKFQVPLDPSLGALSFHDLKGPTERNHEDRRLSPLSL